MLRLAIASVNVFKLIQKILPIGFGGTLQLVIGAWVNFTYFNFCSVHNALDCIGMMQRGAKFSHWQSCC